MSNYERTNLSSLGFEWEMEKKSQNNISKNKLRNSITSYSRDTLNRKPKTSQNTNELEQHWSRIIDKMTVDKIPVVLYIQVIRILF